MVALGGSQPRSRTLSGHAGECEFLTHAGCRAAGARTQLTGVVGALAVTALLIFVPNLLQDLPRAALAAVVISAAFGLIEIADLRRIYRIQRWEFWLSVVCLAVWPSWAPSRGLSWRWCLPSSSFSGTAGDRIRPCWAASMISRATTTSPGIRRRVSSRACAISVGCTPVLRERRIFPGAGARRGGGIAHAGVLAGRRRRTDHSASTSHPPMSWTNWTRNSKPQASTCVLPR